MHLKAAYHVLLDLPTPSKEPSRLYGTKLAHLIQGSNGPQDPPLNPASSFNPLIRFHLDPLD
jgi:hypothetical protein